LTNEKPADKITGVFTMTEMADDSRRAQLPGTSGGGFGDTSPIGFSLDLSSKTTVWKPIPGDDQIDESAHPVPALMVLNNEGVLASWWIIYSESIRGKTVYPGLVVAEGMATPQKPATTTTPAPAFGSSSNQSFGNQPSTASPFGASKPGATFGGTGAFGSPSAIGQKQSPWGGQSFGTPSFGAPSMATPAAKPSNPAFGAPAFGATSTPAFGQAGLPGRQSVWGSSNTPSQSTGTAFGQPTALGSTKPVFGSGTTSTSTQPQASGGFANFANKGGFAAAAAAPATGQSIFGSTGAAPSATGVFGSNNAPSSGGVFGSGNTGAGQSSTSTLFGGASNNEAKPASTFGGNKFSLGTTFKADTSKESEPGNTSAASSSFFGGGFGTALKEAEKTPDVQATVSKEADMDTEDTAEAEQSSKAQPATPDAIPAPAKSSFFSTAPSSGAGIFGQPSVKSQQLSSQPPQTKPVLSADPPASTPTVQASSNPFTLGSTTGVPVANPFAASISSKPTTTPASPPSQVKQEPSSDKESLGVSKSIPQAPLSPDSRSKSSYPLGESSASASENDAPLPPDFATKPKASTDRNTDAPLPPDFTFKPKPKPIGTPQAAKVKSEQEAPPSEPPSDDVPAGPEDEGDDSDFITEDEGDDQSKEPSDEGSGEDLGKVDSPTSEFNVTPGLTPQGSFGGRQNIGADSSPLAKTQKSQPLGQSRGLFGEIGTAAPVLPPPKGPLQPPSPRSPSPVRSAIPPRMMRPDASRSVSAPNAAVNLLGGRKPPMKTMVPSQSTFKTSVDQEQLQEQRRFEARARKEAEETRSLVDDEDEKMQRYLSEDIEGTRTLDEFIAHSDVNRPESADSIPAQVEILYRDINSMIDTLGVNAKALKSFIKGHTEQYKEDRGKEDLEDQEGWCLDEIDALSYIIEKELGRELEMGRIQDPASKVETCEELQKDLIKLRQKHEDIKKIVASHTHPDHIASARAQPLTAEQAAQQHDLRRDYLEFQKLLSEAEEALTVLRAKVASQSTSVNSKTAAPTVEAIMRTIAKMTSMAEKRSGDVDVLEGQMRKLRFNTTSRESSPALRTPQKNGNNRLSMRVNTPGTSSTNRLFYTPESNFRGSASRRMGGSAFMMSGGGSVMGSPSPRKKISGYTRDEKSMLSEKAQKKMKVREKLRKAVMQAGVNVSAMPENDDY
jgi:nucleoporin NUP159